MASKNDEGRVFIQRVPAGFDGKLAFKIVKSQQLACAPMKSKEKGIEVSLKGHHLALVPSSHGLRCMVSVPAFCSIPLVCANVQGFCQAWDESL